MALGTKLIDIQVKTKYHKKLLTKLISNKEGLILIPETSIGCHH